MLKVKTSDTFHRLHIMYSLSACYYLLYICHLLGTLAMAPPTNQPFKTILSPFLSPRQLPHTSRPSTRPLHTQPVCALLSIQLPLQNTTLPWRKDLCIPVTSGAKNRHRLPYKASPRRAITPYVLSC